MQLPNCLCCCAFWQQTPHVSSASFDNTSAAFHLEASLHFACADGNVHRSPPPSPPCSQVGNQFVSQYYTVQHASPKHLHRFYSDASTLTYGDVRPEGFVSKNATGQKVTALPLCFNLRACISLALLGRHQAHYPAQVLWCTPASPRDTSPSVPPLPSDAGPCPVMSVRLALYAHAPPPRVGNQLRLPVLFCIFPPSSIPA
jgi:hypothetical protein